MYGHDLEAYVRRLEAFGWETAVIDGHYFGDILSAFGKVRQNGGAPLMIIAKTLKGKGVSILEDKTDWHGLTLNQEALRLALNELGEVDETARGSIPMPEELRPDRKEPVSEIPEPYYEKGKKVPTRNAYGTALMRIFPRFPDLVVLDAEVSNSTKTEIFGEKYPDRFFEMFIAEQNMVGTAVGLSARGKLPFVSTFAAFFTRAYDQIRMSQYSNANIKFCGSHAGVSIGEDGPSQMGLEDIAMFRSVLNSVVLYPSDAVSAEKLIEEMASHKGISYIRTTRGETPVIYDPSETFSIGGSKVLRSSHNDAFTVIGAGITLHEALGAYDKLKKQEIAIRVIDLYSIKPVDTATLEAAALETKGLIVVEDHHREGGIAEAVRSALPENRVPVHSLAVTKIPMSGKPEELLDFEGISRKAIVKKIKELML
jgi:transketolase